MEILIQIKKDPWRRVNDEVGCETEGNLDAKDYLLYQLEDLFGVGAITIAEPFPGCPDPKCSLHV